MNKRVLGRTGLEVSQLGMGGLFVSSIGGAYEQAKNAIYRAMELGINYIDTAAMYFNSEEVIGNALEGVTAPLVLSTKVGGRPGNFDARDRDCLLKSVEDSFKFLKRDYIDIFMVHEPDRPAHFDWWTDPAEFHGPIMEILEDLKKQGKIGYIGLGGTTAYEIVHAIKTGKFDVVLTAFNYSLLWREAEHQVLPEALKQRMGIIIGSPLQQGALACRYDQEVKNGAPWLSLPRRRQFLALYELLDETGIPLPELSMRFVISNPDISCVLTGARSAQEVELNAAAVEKGPLSGEILARLDEIAAMVPFRPYEEPFALPFRWEYKGPGVAGR